MTRDEALAQARAIVAATDLPVSADLEKGFGDAPAGRGGNDPPRGGGGAGRRLDRGRDRRQGRSRSTTSATRPSAWRRRCRPRARWPFPFTLTARAENFLRGNPDLDDTIRRLQAFEKAGADVLFAPGLPDLAAVRAVCAAVSKPFNFMVGIKGKSFTVAELEAAGVRRISLATSLYRAAMSGLLDAAREVKDKGSFGYLDRSLTTPDLNGYMQ